MAALGRTVVAYACAECGHEKQAHGMDRWHCDDCGPRKRTHRYVPKPVTRKLEDVRL